MNQEPTGNSEPIRKKRGNPQNLKPFKPGQSGNPAGRPKKKPLTELYEKLLANPKVMKQVEASVVKMLVSGRMVGQLQLKEMAERVEGKVSQKVELDGEIRIGRAEAIQRARQRAKGK